MTITESDSSLKNKINEANPNALPDHLRAIGFGDVLRQLPTFLCQKAPAASSYNLATVEAVPTAEDAKCAKILRAYARAGGVTGHLTLAAMHATPGTGEISIAPNGEIVTLAADAITSIDVLYVPEKYETVELTLPVASDTLTIPTALTDRGVLFLMEAEITAGTLATDMIVLTESNSKPATTKALLNVEHTQVLFAVADAATEARVKLAVACTKDVDALLTANASY